MYSEIGLSEERKCGSKRCERPSCIAQHFAQPSANDGLVFVQASMHCPGRSLLLFNNAKVRLLVSSFRVSRQRKRTATDGVRCDDWLAWMDESGWRI